jgi:iron complex outermembrane receptor protein
MRLILFISIIYFSLIRISASEVEADSLKVYRLGELNISEEKNVGKIGMSRYDVQQHEVHRSDATSVNQLQLYIPSGRIRYNSRGESMLFLRGAGERQLGLFFDGVQMNIPWDNRFDLTFIPADVIGRISVNKNAGSVLYGPNVLGGAVNISTIERSSEGFGINARVQAENSNSINTALTHDGKIGNFNYIANVSYYKSDGSILSSDVPDTVINQDVNSKFITNTDMKRLFAYLRSEYKFSELTTLGLSLSWLDGEKGVAPENDNTKPRYWRYPELNKTLFTLNLEQFTSENQDAVLRATLWYDIFNQTIEDYKSIAYDKNEMNAIQKDNDLTLGGRLAFMYRLGQKQNLNWVFNGFVTRHKETITEELLYSQNTINTGLEYDGSFDRLSINAGVGYDRNETPKTGLFTEYEGLTSSDWAGFIYLDYRLSNTFGLFGNLSRRTRFATMRESYSGALNKFMVNPELRPETGILSELGLSYDREDFNLRVSGYYNHYTDLITQITLTKEQDSLKRKMRINVGTADIYGLDLSFRFNPFNQLALEGSFTYLLSNGEDAEGNEIEHFDDKPEILAGLSALYKLSFGLDLLAELELTGSQWESDASLPGGYAELGASSSINFRISYTFYLAEDYLYEIYLRANNIFDTYRLSQGGLPEPGRTLIAGLGLRI